MKFIQLFFFCTLCFSTLTINAQETTQQLPNTVENQLKKLYKNSNNYQVYKVVNKESYKRLQRNILDSISVFKKDVVSKQQQILEQQESITSLNNTITKLNGDLSVSLTKEDNISLFGLQLNKATYNTILWGLITALLASLLFFIYKFNGSSSLTKEAKNTLAEVEQEFEEHRKKSIEKEQKVRRQLQDEINKHRT